MQLDAVIFGGGAAGLWLLDELLRAGQSVLLLEAAELGAGQTVASQGIIHGGLKYTLQGMLSPSAANIREMPGVWRDCLNGRRQPNLQHTRLRAQHCYLWRTESMSSRLGMIGARFGLRVAAESIDAAQRPALLAHCPRAVARLAEQVIAPASFLTDLASQHWDRILKIDADDGLTISASSPGWVERIEIADPDSGDSLALRPRHVIFTAGSGNAGLRKLAGLSSQAMQRRPLHMAMVRGMLAPLNGHCVDGAKTRVTMTSDVDLVGRTVWQLGGQLAEDGVDMDEARLIARAHDELQAVIPGVDLSGAEWAAYRVDRAEGSTPHGGRPESFQIIQNGNTITAWPTKLAFVPQLAAEIASIVASAKRAKVAEGFDVPDEWPRPRIALPPWEIAGNWRRYEDLSQRWKKAA